jgi:adenylosuccinate lyase
MIERYTRPEMGRIWTEDNKFSKWLEVELAALDALAQCNYIPKDIPKKIRTIVRTKLRKINVRRIKEIEKTVNHDVIAFLTYLAEVVGPSGRYVHFGLTSSDILDTALALQLNEASRLLLDDLQALKAALRKLARRHKWTLMVGRSHGVHAEPITFGLKAALFYQEFDRNLKRLERAAESVSHGKISGAVGTFANVPPKVEALVCKKLGLSPAPISTQIIQRDRHAEFLTTIAIIGGSLEKLATELRNLQKTETLEVEEHFGKGQKGSSAMPHKRNPITSEKIAGLSRVLRGNALAALENIALWHERDITHSSVERIIFPDSTILLDHMLVSMTKLISNLRVRKEQMRENLERSRGMVFSQGLLLKLIQKGCAREQAYSYVQGASKKVWENGVTLRQAVSKDRHILKYLTKKEIDSTFNYKYHTKHVEEVFRRVGIK